MNRKTLLVVDDDPSCARFLVTKVHEETGLVALGAENLRQASSLIQDARIHLDAVLTDVFFDHDSDAPDLNLLDGLDLLQLAHEKRPSLNLYVFSFFVDDDRPRSKAATMRLPIRDWFQKLAYAGPDEVSIWKSIAADLDCSASTGSQRQHSKFDVFLAHNSRDKDVVERIARELERLGLHPWLDKWEIPPGRLFQDALAAAIEMNQSVAVFVGAHGIGPWQDLEQKAAISQFVKRRAPVIPVLLQCSFDDAQLPMWLREFNCVYFNDSIPYAESIAALVWGIKGHRES